MDTQMRSLERKAAMGDPDAAIRLARLSYANGFEPPVLTAEDLATLSAYPSDLCGGWGWRPGRSNECYMWAARSGSHHECPHCGVCSGCMACRGLKSPRDYSLRCMYAPQPRCGETNPYPCSDCTETQRVNRAIATLRGLRAMAALLGFVPSATVDPAQKWDEWETQMWTLWGYNEGSERARRYQPYWNAYNRF